MRDAETTLAVIRERGKNDRELTTGEPDAWKLARPVVCPGKADVLSGSQSRRGKSRTPVAWMAGRRETDCPEAHRHGHPRDGRRVTGP